MGQGLDERRFSGLLISHMVMRELDKTATWFSSGENAISIRLTTSQVFVSHNSTNHSDWVTTIYPEGETAITFPILASS